MFISGINRIRLEFKDVINTRILYWQWVLIESDWNLKYVPYVFLATLTNVLIESDWNLKVAGCEWLYVLPFVLIESDWNLKPCNFIWLA